MSAPVEPGFVLEIVERANDRFLARIEGLNAVLIGELAATLGIAGIVLDKYSDMGQGLVLLAVAYVVSGFGLAEGTFWWRPVDAPHPIEAIVLLEKRADGIALLTKRISSSWVNAQRLRRDKTVCVGLALLFLTLGTIAAVREKVVESRHETGHVLNGSTRPTVVDARPGGRTPEAVRHIRR